MINIRPFQPVDQQNIRELISDIMTDEFAEERQAYPFDDIADIQKHYHGKGEGFFVAHEGNKIVGTVGIKREDGRIALLRRLFVSKNHRKKQVGQKLLEKAIQFCKDNGYGELVFKATSKMSAARNICQKAGFVQRASLKLGSLELFKMALHLNDGVHKPHA